MLLKAALGAAFLLAASGAAAQAQPLPPANQRTVTWYASHPSERAQVRRICVDDPGHLMQSPDCINAKRGDLNAAIRSNRLDMSSPDGPEYWTRRPLDRANKLAMCSHMTPEHQANDHCDVPRRSLLAEQQTFARR